MKLKVSDQVSDQVSEQPSEQVSTPVNTLVSTPVQSSGLVSGKVSGLPSEQVGEQVGEQVSEQVGEQVSEQVGEQVTKLLVAIENDKVSMAHLRDILNINSRSYIHTDILTPAIVSGLVAREYPDSPNHPRQKYYLTEKGKAMLEQIKIAKDAKK